MKNTVQNWYDKIYDIWKTKRTLVLDDGGHYIGLPQKDIAIFQKYCSELSDDQVWICAEVLGIRASVDDLYKYIPINRITGNLILLYLLDDGRPRSQVSVTSEAIEEAVKALVIRLKTEDFRRHQSYFYLRFIKNYMNIDIISLLNRIGSIINYNPIIYDILFNAKPVSDCDIQQQIWNTISFDEANKLGFNLYFPHSMQIIDKI